MSSSENDFRTFGILHQILFYLLLNKLKFNLFFSTQKRWMMLCFVVSPGTNCFPVEVYVKMNKELSWTKQIDFVVGNCFTPHIYSDPVQEGIRKVLGKSLIKMSICLTVYFTHCLESSFCDCWRHVTVA